MTEKGQMAFDSDWHKLPKSEQEQIKRKLKALPEKQEQKPAKNSKNSFQLRGYVRCELSAADKEAFKVWEQEHGADIAYGRLIDLVESGYLFKVGDTGSGFQATLCAATTNKPWEGYVLTAHASYAARAARLLLYKHETLMEGDWSAWMTDEGEDFIR